MSDKKYCPHLEVAINQIHDGIENWHNNKGKYIELRQEDGITIIIPRDVAINVLENEDKKWDTWIRFVYYVECVRCSQAIEVEGEHCFHDWTAQVLPQNPQQK